MTTAWLNGAFLPLDEARIPAMDRGFLFGDGVYEVIPVYGKRLFRLEHHLRRLQNSLDAVRIGNPLANETWTSMLDELVRRNGDGDQAVYLQ
ncbi:MAG: aminotransferase class IV, partial [Gammaproteobacteria bacterium]